MVDKSKITYCLTFVPESGIDFDSASRLTHVVGVEAAITAAKAFHDKQWADERTPDLYGPVWQAGLEAIESLRRDDVYVVAVPVEYGALVIC